jgi:hypothetical protein
MVTERNSGSKVQEFRRFTESYLDDFGTTITRSRITETKDSMKRVTGTATATATYKADIQWVTKKDLQHLNVGDVKIGDGMLFVLDSADIELHDEITFNSKQWRVTSQIEGEQVEGEVVYKGYIITKNAQT